jgi:hypothetical protein
VNSQDVINVGVCPKGKERDFHSTCYASWPAIKFISISARQNRKKSWKKEGKTDLSGGRKKCSRQYRGLRSH